MAEETQDKKPEDTTPQESTPETKETNTSVSQEEISKIEKELEQQDNAKVQQLREEFEKKLETQMENIREDASKNMEARIADYQKQLEEKYEKELTALKEKVSAMEPRKGVVEGTGDNPYKNIEANNEPSEKPEQKQATNMDELRKNPSADREAANVFIESLRRG